MLEVLPEQHFTQPPPRFTEATLVKTLEEHGIGRPVHVRDDHLDDPGPRVRAARGKRFFPEDVGEVVTDMLVEHFPDIVDVDFTAEMEEELDDIAEGKLGLGAGAARVLRAVRTRLLEKAEDKIKRYARSSTSRARAAPKRAASRPAGSRSSAGTASSSGAPFAERLRLQVHPQHRRQRASRAGDCSTRRAPSAAARSAARSAASGPSSGAPATPSAATSRRKARGPASPARVQAGRDRPEAARGSGDVLRLRPLPGLRLRGRQPAGAGQALPRVRLGDVRGQERSGAGSAAPWSTRS